MDCQFLPEISDVPAPNYVMYTCVGSLLLFSKEDMEGWTRFCPLAALALFERRILLMVDADGT